MKANQIVAKAICIILRDKKEVLVGMGYDEKKNEHFGRLVGGGVEFGESGEDAVRREIKEELNSELENLEFIKVVENIFSYNGDHGHQIIFLFKGELSDKSLYAKEKIPVIDTKSYDAVWLPLQDIMDGKIKLYPEFDINLLLS